MKKRSDMLRRKDGLLTNNCSHAPEDQPLLSRIRVAEPLLLEELGEQASGVTHGQQRSTIVRQPGWSRQNAVVRCRSTTHLRNSVVSMVACSPALSSRVHCSALVVVRLPITRSLPPSIPLSLLLLGGGRL